MTQHSPHDDRVQADRYLDAQRQIQEHGLAELLDWLASQPRFEKWELQLQVRQLDEDGDPLPWVVVDDVGMQHLGETIFAGYFQLDLDAVERHRLAELDRIRRRSATDYRQDKGLLQDGSPTPASPPLDAQQEAKREAYQRGRDTTIAAVCDLFANDTVRPGFEGMCQLIRARLEQAHRDGVKLGMSSKK